MTIETDEKQKCQIGSQESEQSELSLLNANSFVEMICLTLTN